MENTAPYYQTRLSQELSRRCANNPRYSIRAFARALGLDPGVVSRILSGKRVPSYRVAKNILEKLGLPPQDQAAFLESIAQTHQGRGLERIAPVFQHWTETQKVSLLDQEYFRVIADWYHYAILELTYVEGFESDPRWIASELGITLTETKLALERLKRLGLLEEKRGRLRETLGHATLAEKHTTTPALKRHQKQLLDRATESLENDPIEQRSMTSMIMAIAPTKLPMARQMIEDFTQRLCQLLESAEKKQVYALGIQLYPLQKNRRESHEPRKK